MSNGDWDSVVSKLNGSSGREPASVSSVISGLVTVVLLCSFTALMLVICNSILLKAWPAMVYFSPGIGFAHAFIISSCLWVLFFVKKVVAMALESSDANR